MIYKIEFENLFSFKDRQCLDLSVAPNVPEENGRYATVFPGATVRAPRVVAVIGANASGKTNLLRVLGFLLQFLRTEVTQQAQVTVAAFNDAESPAKVSSIAVEFGGVVNYSPDTFDRLQQNLPVEYGVYRYELEFQIEKFNVKSIFRESLKQKPLGAGKWQSVFKRDNDHVTNGSKGFLLPEYRHVEKKLLPQVSLLTVFAAHYHPAASALITYIRNCVCNDDLSRVDEQTVVHFFKGNPAGFDFLNSQLPKVDLGISQVDIEAVSHTRDGLFFRHAGLPKPVEWLLESRGTQQMVKLLPLLKHGLDGGHLLVIDELDMAIHPMVLRHFITMFTHPKVNVRNAQLWFSCQNATLLEELNKEEIVICEKTSDSRSRVLSLMDIKSRRDVNHYKKYMQGEYGGLPIIG